MITTGIITGGVLLALYWLVRRDLRKRHDRLVQAARTALHQQNKARTEQSVAVAARGRLSRTQAKRMAAARKRRGYVSLGAAFFTAGFFLLGASMASTYAGLLGPGAVLFGLACACFAGAWPWTIDPCQSISPGQTHCAKLKGHRGEHYGRTTKGVSVYWPQGVQCPDQPGRK